MLGKIVSKKQANIRKGNSRNKRKIYETKNNNVFERGVDGQKTQKNGILKGMTKGKPKKTTKWEEKNDFKDRPLRGTK